MPQLPASGVWARRERWNSKRVYHASIDYKNIAPLLVGRLRKKTKGINHEGAKYPEPLHDTFSSCEFVSLFNFVQFYPVIQLTQQPLFRLAIYPHGEVPCRNHWEIPGQLFGNLLNFEQ
jgi:hypothetical protein